MAVGFTPKFTKDITLNTGREHCIVTAFKTFDNLGWKTVYISPNGLIAYTNKGMFATNAEIRVIVTDTTITITSSSTGSEMVDLGKNKKFVEQFIDCYTTLLEAGSTEESVHEYNQLKQNFPPQDEEDYLLAPPVSGIKSFLTLFTPVKGYFITPILILVNIAVFIVMVCNGINFMEPSAESMLSWGANFKPVTLDGQWYRLFTCCFIHFGLLHLVMNMYALSYIGLLLEPRLGKSRFLAGYVLAGLVASATSLWWNDFVVSGGASGAIFGMYGLFLALLTTNAIEKSVRKSLMASIGVFVAFNIFSGMAVSGIDNAAHVGGLLGGFVIGYIFIPSLRKPSSAGLKFVGIIAAAVVCAGIIFAACNYTSNDIAKYDVAIKEFGINETKALQVYNLDDNAPKHQILESLKTGLQYWHKNRKLVADTDMLDLPESLHKQNKKLIKYCDLRIEIYTLASKNITEDTQAYVYRLSELNKEINALLDENFGGTKQDPPPSQ